MYVFYIYKLIHVSYIYIYIYMGMYVYIYMYIYSVYKSNICLIHIYKL